MTYAEKLRDPRWQKKRLQILDRDKWTCQACRATESTLQVHHLYYARLDPWDYPDEVYQTLCERCHKQRQKIIDKAVEEIRVQIGRIPTNYLSDILDEAYQSIAVSADYFKVHGGDK